MRSRAAILYEHGARCPYLAALKRAIRAESAVYLRSGDPTRTGFEPLHWPPTSMLQEPSMRFTC
jgi:hypothetical protein